jgi:UTP:GlnB (protein PII) uridylyltransferase
MLVNGFRAFTRQPGLLAQLIGTRATELGLHIESIATLAPTLEDVFLTLTAKRRP